MKSKSPPATTPRLNMKRIDAFLKFYKKLQKTQKVSLAIGTLSLLIIPIALATMNQTTQDRSKAAPTPQPRCKVIGCNHQYCVPINSQDISPTCTSTTPDKCTSLTTCELQPSGECDWTPTKAYTQCIKTQKL